VKSVRISGKKSKLIRFFSATDRHRLHRFKRKIEYITRRESVKSVRISGKKSKLIRFFSATDRH